MIEKKNWFFIFLRIFCSFFALFLIIYYLYLRVIVKKLPQDLPSENHPIFSVILYTWLVILYLCLIIIPIILPIVVKYRGKKEPSARRIKITEGLKNFLSNIRKPIIWLYEDIKSNIPNWPSKIIKIGALLYKFKNYHRIIGFCIYIMPRLLAGITLFIDITYFHKIHNFYYVILLTLITIIFNIMLLILQHEAILMGTLVYELNIASAKDVSNFSISELKKN